jgi:hypothetical protein
MRHQFTIIKKIQASKSNVIANYLDLEHIPVHSGLRSCRVLTETERAACFELTSRVGPFNVHNVHYFEFRPPDQIFHAVKSPLGPMYVVSTARELASGTPDAHCEVEVVTTVDLPGVLWPVRKLVERLLRYLNDVVLREDLTILERRQALFGDWVEDYLREQQCMLFKDLFREHYARPGGGLGGSPAA